MTLYEIDLARVWRKPCSSNISVGCSAIKCDAAKPRGHGSERIMRRQRKSSRPCLRQVELLPRIWSPLHRGSCLRRPEYVGFLPPSDPYHQRVCLCLLEAGFTGVRVGVNRDYSMVTFWLNNDAHPSLRNESQAQKTILCALDCAGILCELDSLVVDIRDEKVCGAFLPVREG